MYDDKLDRLIDDKRYLDKVRDYKARQVEITEQMTRHKKADHNFYVTANMVMNLAARVRGIFESSEVDDLVDLKSDLEEILGRKVDIVTYDSIYWGLREQILAQQVIIL